MADDTKADAPKPVDTSPAPPKPADAVSGSGASGSPTTALPGPKVVATDTTSSEDKPTDTKPADTKPIVSGSPARPPGRGSEWTASDDRGPLGRADDDLSPPLADAATGREGAPTSISDSGSTATVASGSAVFGSATHEDPSSGGTTPKSTDTSAASDAIAARPETSSSSGPLGSVSPKADTEAKRALWPVAAALILGAVIGAGSAAFVYRGYADDSQPDPEVAKLTTRVDALEKRPDPQSSIATLKSAVTALDNQMATLRQGKGASNAASTPTPPQPAAEPTPAAAPQPTANLDEVNAKIAALQSGLDSLKANGETKALQDKVAALQGEIDKAKSAAEAAQSSASTVAGQQKEIAGKVMVPALAVVADSLVQQIDHGQPYATQVDALVALGADPAKIAVLRENAAKGVPSASQLGARFETLALPIIATVNKASADAGLGERLKSGMLSIVSIRRADDTSGTDLPSRVARIRTALAHDDVAAALDAWGQLPPDAKAKAEAWAALAKEHVEAMNAARALQQDAIAALGAKKS